MLRFFEKLQAQADQKEQSNDQLVKLLEQCGKRFEETTAQLNKRIDDTNARFNGFEKQAKYMVKAILAAERKKSDD
jgi:hypothetical protein